MKRSFVFLALATFCMMAPALRGTAESVTDMREWTAAGKDIASVLQSSAEAWSHGNLDAFMRCYEHSADVSYIKTDGPVRGYAAIRDMYASRFRGGGGMGRLTLQVIDDRPLGPDHALVTGRFALARPATDGGNASGIFTLVFHRSDAGWRIISDHTS